MTRTIPTDCVNVGQKLWNTSTASPSIL